MAKQFVTAEQSVTTASIKAYSLALSFNSSSVSPGDAITFLDPNTFINIALAGDGDGNWKATITCAYQSLRSYNDISVKPGDTAPIGPIGGVDYAVQFGDEPGQRIFEAIRATITGVPDAS